MGSGDSGPRGWLMLSDDVRSKVTSAAFFMSVSSVWLQSWSRSNFRPYASRSISLVSDRSDYESRDRIARVKVCGRLNVGRCDFEAVRERVRSGEERLILAVL